uniref:Uncharacterized protein n=1 Tax=Arundo donax TaxID=35708 RepID=A0A0A8XZ86_ARUDO
MWHTVEHMSLFSGILWISFSCSLHHKITGNYSDYSMHAGLQANPKSWSRPGTGTSR